MLAFSVVDNREEGAVLHLLPCLAAMRAWGGHTRPPMHNTTRNTVRSCRNRGRALEGKKAAVVRQKGSSARLQARSAAPTCTGGGLAYAMLVWVEVAWKAVVSAECCMSDACAAAAACCCCCA